MKLIHAYTAKVNRIYYCYRCCCCYCDSLIFLLLLHIIHISHSHPLHIGSLDFLLRPIFIAIYSFEFLIKIIARGFALTPFAYLRNPWHQLDLFLLVTA